MAVTLGVEAPLPQRRVTVAFRGILAIPHFVYAAILGFVSFFAVVIAWFAALFTGRVPTGIADFLTRVMQYSARVYGYGQMLLTDRYPPFDLGEIDAYTPYPVELTLDPPDRLNRAAVLFRAILMIPAAIVAQLVTAGMWVVLLVVWLITLITGRIPQAAFEANTSALRYLLRLYAFAAMLTSEYPRGLFGDRPAPPPPAEPVDPVDLADSAAPDLPPDLPATPRITRLVLSRAAKNLVLLFLALGVLSWVAQIAIGVALSGSSTADDLADGHAKLETSIRAYVSDSQQCAQSSDIVCARAANGRLINGLERFRDDLSSMDFPAGLVDDARTLDRDAAQMISLLAQLSEATDVTQYQSVAAQLSQAGVAFDRHYADLYNALAFD